MKYKQKHYKSINIENIINQRLRLQSVQKNLVDGLCIQGLTDAGQLKTIKFIDFYIHMDEVTKKGFLIGLGGPTNYLATLEYMNEVIKEMQPKIAELVSA